MEGPENEAERGKNWKIPRFPAFTLGSKNSSQKLILCLGYEFMVLDKVPGQTLGTIFWKFS